MRRSFSLLLSALLVVALAACGVDETTDPRVDEREVPSPDDIIPITKTHAGIEYLCFYIYVDGYRAGGPALWCERVQPT